MVFCNFASRLTYSELKTDSSSLMSLVPDALPLNLLNVTCEVIETYELHKIYFQYLY